MTWPRGNSFHTCGEKMPKCVRASAAVSGPECAGEDVQHARAELAVLILLAPDARRQVHQRRERPIGAAERPDSRELFRDPTLALWLTSPIAVETLPAS